MTRPALLVGATACAQLIDLAAMLLLARTLGMEAFGVLVAARAITGLMDALIGFRSWEALLAFVPRFERDENERGARALVALGLLVELCVGAAGIVVAGVVGLVAGVFWPAATMSALLLAVVYARHVGENLVETQQAAFRLRSDYEASAVQALLAPAVRLGAFALMVQAGVGSVVGFAVVDSGAAAGAALVAFVAGRLTRRLPVGRGVGQVWHEHGAELRRFLAHGWLAGAVKGISSYGAESVLAGIGSLSTVGAFGVARRLAGVISFVLSPFLYVVTPWIYRATAAGDVAALRRLILRISLGAAIAVTILDLGLAIGSEALVRLLVGSAVSDAGTAMLWLAVAFSLQFVFCWARPVALGLGMSGLAAGTQLLGGVALVLGTLVLAPTYGAVGAAGAVVVAYVVQIALLAGAVLRRLGRGADGVGIALVHAGSVRR